MDQKVQENVIFCSLIGLAGIANQLFGIRLFIIGTVALVTVFIAFCIYKETELFKRHWVHVWINLQAFVGFSCIVLSIGWLVISKSYCQRYECCTHAWNRHNLGNMNVTLDRKLFGQHLALDIISKTIEQHAFNDSPEKPLVLSFHGSIGTGKKYVSDIIINHLYYLGWKSKFVVRKISSYDYPDEDDIDRYENQIKSTIENQIRICERNLFVFHELESMPEGLIDVLKPYLKNIPEIHGVNYGKNIFIFLSNVGAKEIITETYRHLKSGKMREEITNHQMKNVLQKAILNEPGGLKDTILISSGLIDFFVPFLPLEKKHIKQCVEDSIKKHQEKKPKEKRKPVPDNLKEVIANDVWYLREFDHMFAETGCKRVMMKTAMRIQKF